MTSSLTIEKPATEKRQFNVGACLYSSPLFDQEKHVSRIELALDELARDEWAQMYVTVHICLSNAIPLDIITWPSWVQIWRPVVELPGFYQHLYRYLMACGTNGWWVFRGTDNLSTHLQQTVDLTVPADRMQLHVIAWPSWRHNPSGYPLRGSFAARGDAINAFWEFLAVRETDSPDMFGIDELLLNDWFDRAHIPFLLDIDEPPAPHDLTILLRYLQSGPRFALVKSDWGYPAHLHGPTAHERWIGNPPPR